MDPRFSEPSDMRLGATHMVIPVSLFNRMASVYYSTHPESSSFPEEGGEGEQSVREPAVERERGEGDFQSGPGFGSVMWPEGDPAWERVTDAE